MDLVPPQIQVGRYGTILDVVVNSQTERVHLLWPKSSKIVPRLLGSENLENNLGDIEVAIEIIRRRVVSDVERTIATQMRAKGLTP